MLNAKYPCLTFQHFTNYCSSFHGLLSLIARWDRNSDQTHKYTSPQTVNGLENALGDAHLLWLEKDKRTTPLVITNYSHDTLYAFSQLLTDSIVPVLISAKLPTPHRHYCLLTSPSVCDLSVPPDNADLFLVQTLPLLCWRSWGLFVLNVRTSSLKRSVVLAALFHAESNST